MRHDVIQIDPRPADLQARAASTSHALRDRTIDLWSGSTPLCTQTIAQNVEIFPQPHAEICENHLLDYDPRISKAGLSQVRKVDDALSPPDHVHVATLSLARRADAPADGIAMATLERQIPSMKPGERHSALMFVKLRASRPCEVGGRVSWREGDELIEREAWREKLTPSSEHRLFLRNFQISPACPPRRGVYALPLSIGLFVASDVDRLELSIAVWTMAVRRL
jgi:hypothetical protein